MYLELVAMLLKYITAPLQLTTEILVIKTKLACVM